MKVLPHNNMIEVTKVRVMTKSAYALLEGVPGENKGLPDRFIAVITDTVKEWKDCILLISPYDLIEYYPIGSKEEDKISFASKEAVFAVIKLDPEIITVKSSNKIGSDNNRKY